MCKRCLLGAPTRRPESEPQSVSECGGKRGGRGSQKRCINGEIFSQCTEMQGLNDSASASPPPPSVKTDYRERGNKTLLYLNSLLDLQIHKPSAMPFTLIHSSMLEVVSDPQTHSEAKGSKVIKLVINKRTPERLKRNSSANVN